MIIKKEPFGLLFYYHHVFKGCQDTCAIARRVSISGRQVYGRTVLSLFCRNSSSSGNITGVGDTLLCLLRDTEDRSKDQDSDPDPQPLSRFACLTLTGASPAPSKPDLGLTVTQSMPSGTGSVPFVSIAIFFPVALFRRWMKSSSIHIAGSPPVSTTQSAE